MGAAANRILESLASVPDLYTLDCSGGRKEVVSLFRADTDQGARMKARWYIEQYKIIPTRGRLILQRNDGTEVAL